MLKLKSFRSMMLFGGDPPKPGGPPPKKSPRKTPKGFAGNNLFYKTKSYVSKLLNDVLSNYDKVINVNLTIFVNVTKCSDFFIV